MGIIVAIGGYKAQSSEESWIDTPIEIDKKILDLTGVSRANVLFIPTASGDSLNYVKSIKKIYEGDLGANFDTLLLYKDKLSKKEIKEKIEWADVIYVGGGNTLKMMKLWRRLGVDKMLLSAYENGTVMCGASAGSICWFEYGVSDSLHFYNEKETKYIKVKALGILSGVHCPHFKSKTYDNSHRTKGLREIMKRSKGKCIAVPDACALIIQDGKITTIGEGHASYCWWEKDKWCEEEII